MPNIDRIKRVVEAIETNQNEKLHFDMSNWWTEAKQDTTHRGRELKCGTTMCFAGWAAKVAKKNVTTIFSLFEKDAVVKNMDHVVYNNNTQSIEDWAARYLGLNTTEAQEIFYSDLEDDDPDRIENVDDLKRHIESVLQQKIW